jgi:hypothetical protein
MFELDISRWYQISSFQPSIPCFGVWTSLSFTAGWELTRSHECDAQQSGNAAREPANWSVGRQEFLVHSERTMSVYTGLYVQKDSLGRIQTVKATDSAGGSYALEPSTYTNRGGKPDIDQLPDLATYQLREEFKRIGSQDDLSTFAAKHFLAVRSDGGSKNVYTGSVSGRSIELRERWWDPSSVYSIQRDEHEVSMLIENSQVARIQFTGGS